MLSCTTRLVTEERDVRVTRESAEIQECKSLGFLEADTQYRTADSTKEMKDLMKELKRETGILGGNVLFLRYGRKLSGVAYLCEGMSASGNR